MSISESQKLEELAELTQQQKELEMRIEKLKKASKMDQMELGRLMKNKLRLKGQIKKLQSDLIPDQKA